MAGRGRIIRKAQRREQAGGESIVQAILASGLSNIDAARELNRRNISTPYGRIRRWFLDIDIARMRSRLGLGQ